MLAVLESGTMVTGTVHHIAWRAADRAEQERWRDWIFEKGLRPTSVIDRQQTIQVVMLF